MAMGAIFWMLMILWLVFGAYWYWPADRNAVGPIGGHFLTWICLFLLGWRVFGFVVQ
jgi:hypothetical protein